MEAQTRYPVARAALAGAAVDVPTTNVVCSDVSVPPEPFGRTEDGKGLAQGAGRDVLSTETASNSGNQMMNSAPPKTKRHPDRQPDRDAGGRFLTGNIGGPGRRPGSRNKLGEDFIAAVHDDWVQHGAAVLAKVRKSSPAAYLRVVASIIPQRLAIGGDTDAPPINLSVLSDNELAFLRRVMLKATPVDPGYRLGDRPEN